MFGIGPMEIVVIVVFALLFVGPQKLPELAKQFGKFFVQAKRVTSDVRHTIDGYIKEAEAEIIKEEREKLKKLIEVEMALPEHAHPSHDISHDPHAEHYMNPPHPEEGELPLGGELCEGGKDPEASINPDSDPKKT